METLDQRIGFIIPNVYYILVGNYIQYDEKIVEGNYTRNVKRYIFDDETPLQKIGRIYIIYGESYLLVKRLFDHISANCPLIKNFFQVYDDFSHSNLTNKNSRLCINGEESTYLNPTIYDSISLDVKYIREYNKKYLKNSINLFLGTSKYILQNQFIEYIYNTTINTKKFANIYLRYNDIQISSKLFNDICDEFPLQTNLIETIVGKNHDNISILESQINNCKILVPLHIYEYMAIFLKEMKISGNKIEKNIYKSMTIEDFIIRCISKRYLSFYKLWNIFKFRLKTQRKVMDKKISKSWYENIINFPNRSELPYYYFIKEKWLENYLSYDEMLFSSYIGISTPTFFINDCDKNNFGKEDAYHVKKGIVTSLVGTRFDEILHFDSLFMTISKYHRENMGFGLGLGKDWKYDLWARFYNKDFLPTFEQVSQANDPRYLYIKGYDFFIDLEAYKKKIYLTYKMYIDDIILRFMNHSQEKYLELNKPLYIIFKDINHKDLLIDEKLQTYILVCTIFDILITYINNCKNHNLKILIHTIEFNNIENVLSFLDENFIKFIGERYMFIPQNYREMLEYISFYIKVNYTDKPPFRKELEEYCVACNYAAGPVNLPGNEYWDNGFNFSDEAAIACCSTISQLQNPYINYKLLDKQSINFL